MEGIDWEKQAEEFLKLHGWFQDIDYVINPEAWFHPAFPLGEELSGKDSMLKFCEEFYGKAWESYKSYIEGMSSLNDDTDTENGNVFVDDNVIDNLEEGLD